MIYVDHVIELEDGGAPFDKNNALLRCPACHVRKGGKVRGERVREFW